MSSNLPNEEQERLAAEKWRTALDAERVVAAAPLRERLAADEKARQERVALEGRTITLTMPGQEWTNWNPWRMDMTYAEAKMLEYELSFVLRSLEKSAT